MGGQMRHIAADDAAQEFLARSQLLTARADLIGPAGFDLFEKPVEWQLTSAYRAFLDRVATRIIEIDNKPFFDATAPVRAKYGAQFAELMKRIEAVS